MDIVIIAIAFITQFFPFDLNGRNHIVEASLVVQSFQCRDSGSVPSWETKTPHDVGQLTKPV